MPKFNADLYLDAVARQDKNIIDANESVVKFVENLIGHIANGGSFAPYSTETAERNKIDWGKANLEQTGFSQSIINDLLNLKIFHQEFFGAETIKP